MASVVLDQMDFLLGEKHLQEGNERLVREERRKLLAVIRDGSSTTALPAPWGRSAWAFFDGYDPIREWSAHPIRTLAVFAEKDYQVTAKESELWRAATQTFSADLRVVVLPKVGHVFTPVEGPPTPMTYLVKARAWVTDRHACTLRACRRW